MLKQRRIESIAVIIIMVIVYGCSTKQKESGDKLPNVSDVKIVSGSETPNKIDTQVVLNAIKSTFTWYKKHYDEVSNINFVIASDSFNVPYKINTASVKKYLSLLKSSGFFSDKYIIDQQNYFLDCDKKFQEQKQTDGPPEGLEHDLILLSQEPLTVLESLNKLNLISISTQQSKQIVELSISDPLFVNTVQLNGEIRIDSIYKQ